MDTKSNESLSVYSFLVMSDMKSNKYKIISKFLDRNFKKQVTITTVPKKHYVWLYLI